MDSRAGLGIFSLVAGILILIAPRLLNYVAAAYLIVFRALTLIEG